MINARAEMFTSSVSTDNMETFAVSVIDVLKLFSTIYQSRQDKARVDAFTSLDHITFLKISISGIELV